MDPDRIVFVARTYPHRTDPRLTVIEVDWPRLSLAVDDHCDPAEVAERLIGNHFAVDSDKIQVSVHHVLDGDA